MNGIESGTCPECGLEAQDRQAIRWDGNFDLLRVVWFMQIPGLIGSASAVAFYALAFGIGMKSEILSLFAEAWCFILGCGVPVALVASLTVGGEMAVRGSKRHAAVRACLALMSTVPLVVIDAIALLWLIALLTVDV